MTTMKRSVMTFYSGPLDIYSHQVRIVLAEKAVTVDILNVDADHMPDELLELNPYHSLPTLLDRDLVLYQARIIMEYLDERFPHPPLLPVYPVARAKSRLMMHRIEHDWYGLMRLIQADPAAKAADKARKELAESLTSLSPVFASMPYFMSEDFSLVDCCLAPFFWRLPSLGVKLPPKQAKPILAYCDRVFERDSFQVSLSEDERELRDEHDF